MEIIQYKNQNVYTNLQENYFSNLDDFTKYKILSMKTKLAKRYATINETKAKRIYECGTYLSFIRSKNKETNEIHYHLKAANFCGNRFCLYCAWLKARKLALELKSICSQVEQKSTTKVSYIFLTLTIKNPPLNELNSVVKKMSQSFNDMFKKEGLLKRHILGYLRAVEFLGDNTPSGKAHPHFHCILAVDTNYYKGDNYISQKEWVRLWQKYLKVDYAPVVDVRKIRSKNKKWLELDSAIYEVAKYSVAPQYIIKLSQADFEMLDKQTRGLRQYNKGGAFRNVKPLDNDNYDELESWEVIDALYASWNFNNKKYSVEKLKANLSFKNLKELKQEQKQRKLASKERAKERARERYVKTQMLKLKMNRMKSKGVILQV